MTKLCETLTFEAFIKKKFIDHIISMHPFPINFLLNNIIFSLVLIVIFTLNLIVQLFKFLVQVNEL